MRLSILGYEVDVDESAVADGPGAIRRQVREYECGTRRSFDLRVDVPDSFDGAVYGALCRIPFGETRTYGELAASLDTAPVAVGAACARNRVPLLVPCHRLVASDGSLRGYAAPGGVPLKRRLLELESQLAGSRRADAVRRNDSRDLPAPRRGRPTR